MKPRSLVLAVLAAPAAVTVPLAVAPAPAAASTCTAPVAETFSITGRVHACGDALVDGAGHRVRLLADEVLTMYPGEGDLIPDCGQWTPPPSGLAEHVREWGMNSVQILIS